MSHWAEHGPGSGPPWAHRWPGSRPPWWPEKEPWPPQRRRPFSPRIFLRFAIGFLVFLFLVNLVVAVAVSLVLRVLGLGERDPGTLLWLGAAFLLFLLGLVGVLNAIRRAALPLADLVDAVGRVSDGDYAVRVSVRGPREVRRAIGAFNTMVERLASSDEQRRRLLADVTHELRTPLSVVQGQLEGALDGVYERDDQHLGAVLDETRHIAKIIEDLRTLSLAESGALALSREPTDVGAVIEDAVDAYRAPAESGGVTLRVAEADALPSIDADPTRVRQVVENLLSNALRHTPNGGRVDVVARLVSDAIEVTVRDTGSGISAADLPRVFDRFARSAGSRGTGLGLAIARDLVRAHGGDIYVASDGEGTGTTVRFTLPVAPTVDA